MNIAVILTCFNRKEKTLKCLEGLFNSCNSFNISSADKIYLSVYLTDDGSTDGTSSAIFEKFEDKDIHIVQGDGHCYWAGGMRLAWNATLKSNTEWDFFFLVNDDAFPFENCFEEILKTHKYSIEQTGKAGLYSGICYSTNEPKHLTYSGCVWVNRTTGQMKMLDECGRPQLCDVTNANLLMVHRSVYERIGIFYDGFIHGGADHDYSHQARMSGFPVWVTAKCCGYCDNDHVSPEETKRKLLSMTFKQRKAYFDNPVHSIHDYILGTKRRASNRWLLVAIGRYMNLYLPHLYYALSDFRLKKLQ